MVHVSVIGYGPGNPDLLTLAGKQAIQSADLLIGAERLLQALPEDKAQRKLAPATRATEIAACLQEAISEDVDLEVAVVMSGDIGMFSGTKSLLELLADDEGEFDIELIPGISSAQYFAARLKRPWQSWHCVSAHGITCDPAAALAQHREVFFVTGGDNTVSALCQVLSRSGLADCTVTVGERLSYPDETICSGTARDFATEDFDELSVMLVEAEIQNRTCKNDDQMSSAFDNQSWNWSQTGIPDDCFERTRVPMTKQEIRAVMLSKLKVAEDDIVYDIGSGSGSVSVELALLAKKGKVYAIEHEPDAVALTKTNLARFGLDKVSVVEGSAPQALVGLPAPDAAFIGGSGTKLEDILSSLINKNNAIRLCIACVTVETLTEACCLLSSDAYFDFEVCEVSIARSEAVGRYSMLKAQNPIFLVSATGTGATEPDPTGNLR